MSDSSGASDGRHLSERIAAGESPTAIMLSLLPSAQRESLARCAAVRIFDDELFARHLRCGTTDLPDLLEHGWIQQLSGPSARHQRYQIASHLREDAWNLWGQDLPADAADPPPELRQLSAVLAGYFEAINWPVEQLRQLAIADAASAKQLFVEIYRDKDHDFDLAYCQDLVDALSEPGRTRFLPKDLTDLVTERRRRITARGMRATEYYQTREVSYQPRRTAEDHLHRLLKPGLEDNRLLLLHGQGGTGKSTLLHWFISRVCVRRDPLVACARIDCDTLDPAAVLVHPWLLLIEAAEQLNRQLPGGPFRDLLRAFGDYRRRLRRVPSGVAATDGDGQRIERVGYDVELRFSRALVNAPPMLIALDGLDDITSLSRPVPAPLLRLIEMLLHVQSRVDNLRVVLAGRDDLSELVPELMAGAQPIGISSYGMEPFDEGEAVEYLKRRGVTDRPRVQAIFGKSEGMPLVVALYADFVEGKRPKPTAKEIEENTEPLIEYLIPRILAQITHPVICGALLYSVVVPSDLTFEFFSHVMLPLWREQAKGAGIPKDLNPEVPWVPHQIPQPDDFEGQRRLWRDVVEQAGKSRWISVREPDGEQSVVAHPDVRVPLCVKVRDYPTFNELHERAADYYQRRVDESLDGYQLTDDWRRWTKEVIYHRFQRQDPDATAYWRASLGQARLSRRVDWARELANYLLHAEFRDAGPYADFTVLSRQALYEAHVELALVAAQNAGQLPGFLDAGAADWIGEATAALARARDVRILAAAARSPVEAADYETIVFALITVEMGRPDDALAELDRLASTAAAALGDASLVRARAHVSRYGPVAYPDWPADALDAYEAACGYHTESQNRAYVALDAALWLLRIDRPDLALKWSDRAEAAWPNAVHPGGSGTEVRARILLALGRPAGALATLTPPAGPSPSGRARRLAAEARLALRWPVTAVDDLIQRHSFGPDREDPVDAGIEHELLLARAYGMLMDVDGAEDCFKRAQRPLTAQPDEDLQARVNTAAALFELTVVGNIVRACPYLASDPPPTTVPPGRPTWTGFQLARAELADRQKRAADVRQILTDVREKLIAAQAPASSLVQVSIAGLAAHSLLPGDRRDHLHTLVKELAAIVPAARPALVAGLLRCRPVTADRDLADRLCALVVAGDPPGPTEADASQQDAGQPEAEADAPLDYDAQLDQAWRDLTMAQLFRVTGKRGDHARRRAAALLTLRDDPFIRWELLAAWAQSADGQTPLHDPDGVPPDPYQFHERYGHHARLFAAFMTEWARQYDESQRGEESYLWLHEAKRKLDARPGRRRTARQALLYEALARRAEDRGLQAARELKDQAAKIWAELDDHRSRSASAASELPSAPWDAGPSAVTELLLSESRQGRDLRLGERRAPRDQTDPAKPLRVRSNFADTDLGFDTLALSWGRRAGELLRGGMSPLLAHDRSDVVDVRVQMIRPGLASDPWELVAVEDRPLATHPSLRFIFRSPSDVLSRRQQGRYLRRAIQGLRSKAGRAHRGLADPAVDAWLEESHRDHNLPPNPDNLPPNPDEARPETWRAIRAALREQVGQTPARPLRIRVIQPVIGGDLDTHRGLGERLDELVRTYQAVFARSGAHWPDLRITYGSEITNLYAGRPDPGETADVLHVCTVMDATEQLPVLGLDDGSGPPLTAPELDLLIQRLTHTVPPLVILDVQAPTSPVETRRQLLMRNRYAHQLLTLGSVNTIIACGLAGQSAPAQWQVIAEGLAGGQNAAEICRAIQRHQPAWSLDASNAEDQDTHAVAFAATALFTSIQADSLIEPGLIA